VTGANRHDVTQLGLVLDEIIIERPEDLDQHLCTDLGYDYLSARQKTEVVPFFKPPNISL
jgi:hypothetical protein